MVNFFKNIYGDKMVTMTLDEYEELVNTQTFLECLEGQGVDNWVGYDDARKEFNELIDGERD